jgi:hypothetical protein
MHFAHNDLLLISREKDLVWPGSTTVGGAAHYASKGHFEYQRDLAQQASNHHHMKTLKFLFVFKVLHNPTLGQECKAAHFQYHVECALGHCRLKRSGLSWSASYSARTTSRYTFQTRFDDPLTDEPTLHHRVAN